MDRDQTVIELDMLSDQAAIWFQRMSDKSVGAETQTAFDEWIRADDTHKLAYEEYSAIWDHPEFEAILQEFADDGAQYPANENKSFLKTIKWGVLAASLIICVSVIFYGLDEEWSSKNHLEYQTAVGEFKNVTFPDGSLVVLNTDTKLHISFGDQRKVYLTQGEAYFDIKKDGRDFIVEGGTGRIKVLGTAFNARVNYNQMVVAVDRGKVSVSSLSMTNNDEKTLLALDRLAVTDEKLGTVLKSREKVADWREGWLDVNDRSLAEVVEELDRYYAGEIRLGKSDMWQLRVTGRFNLKNIKKATRLLGGSMNLKVTVTKNNEIIIG